MFRETWHEHDVSYVFTFLGAKEELQEKKFDMLFLDHDLGDEFEDGTMLSFWIRDALPAAKLPKAIVIHSNNPVATMEMFNILSTLKGVNIITFPFSDKLKPSLFKGLK